MNKCKSLTFHSQIIAPEFNGGFKSATAMFSNFYPNSNLGLNLFIQNDISPNFIFNNSTISSSLIYNIKISQNLNFSPWIQPQIKLLFINPNKIILGSMLDYNTGQIISSADYHPQNALNYRVNLNFGFLFFSKNFFLGLNTQFIPLSSEPITKKFSFWTTTGLKFNISQNTLSIVNNNINLNNNQILLIYETKKLWVGSNLNFFKTYLTKIGVDLGLKFRKYSMAFNYTIFAPGLLANSFELSIIFKFHCKKYNFNTIFCPAYQL